MRCFFAIILLILWSDAGLSANFFEDGYYCGSHKGWSSRSDRVLHGEQMLIVSNNFLNYEAKIGPIIGEGHYEFLFGQKNSFVVNVNGETIGRGSCYESTCIGRLEHSMEISELFTISVKGEVITFYSEIRSSIEDSIDFRSWTVVKNHVPDHSCF